MPSEIPLAEAANLRVRAWTIVDGSLRLRFTGSEEDLAVRCVCGRCHWVVETHASGTRGVLAVKCHGCGTKADLVLEVSPAPPS